TLYYFRSELQMTSRQGLDVYGAVTWGQFFVYQGFNAHNGWMHTSYGGDAIDEYAETVVHTDGGPGYRYGPRTPAFSTSRISVPYRSGDSTAIRTFTVYRSHHGPVVREQDGHWITVRMLFDPVRALEQSYLRTKTRDYAGFLKVQNMRTDTSNNTV